MAGLLFNKFKGDMVRVLLAQESGQVLDEEQLAFLAHLGVADVQVTQIIILLNVAFQTDDLDAYDSDCDDISSSKAVLMANLSSYDSDVLFELSSREKLIDSQIDDMIQKKNALKQEIDSLKQTLSKQVKEKESLLQTCTVFKKESKEKENKYMDKEIALENKIKELDNIIYKVGKSTQTMHKLIKP
ncbi:hypothetical protein Tco_1149576 [Tanacetum coccineum]